MKEFLCKLIRPPWKKNTREFPLNLTWVHSTWNCLFFWPPWWNKRKVPLIWVNFTKNSDSNFISYLLEKNKGIPIIIWSGFILQTIPMENNCAKKFSVIFFLKNWKFFIFSKKTSNSRKNCKFIFIELQLSRFSAFAVGREGGR